MVENVDDYESDQKNMAAESSVINNQGHTEGVNEMTIKVLLRTLAVEMILVHTQTII